MLLIAFPLLLIPFAIYNMIVYITPGWKLTDTLFSVHMLSGAEMAFSTSDLLLILAVFLLFGEMLKATRIGLRSIVDHMLSLLLLIVMLAEFLMSTRAATSTFLLLTVMSFVDVIGGFSITIRAAQRDIAIDSAEKFTQG
jgi:hypothetical protein